ncbi:MAG: HlyC/CorC family transporter [Planctomycetota bacterium]|nr:HlyC/CorC family transporter [Planctomycetota bacterium]
MLDVLFECLLVLALLMANGVFAMSEMAIVSSRRARLQQRAFDGHKGARAALDLATNPGDFLSTVQIGITLIGIGVGAYSGRSIGLELSAWMNTIPLLAPYREPLALGVTIVAITLVSLVVGELVPKRLALSAPEAIAAAVAGPMRILARITSPAVWLLGASTSLILKLMRVRPPADAPVTEDEIKIMVEQATNAGVLEPAEQDIVKNVFRLGDTRVGGLMTPRSDIVWLDTARPLAENMARVAESHHSYFPVCQGSLDVVLGLASVKDLWAAADAHQPVDLGARLIKPLYVPESMTGLNLLELFKQARKHLALVVDEYGSIQGVVTVIDVLEAMVGDLPGVEEHDEEMIVRRADGSMLLDGLVPVGRFKEVFRIKALPNEDRGYYQTLGGFLMTQLGRMPRTTDSFEWGGFRFEVVDMDGNRVDKVMVTPLKKPDPRAS